MKSALVTGGGSGIGRSISLQFAQARASVAVVDLNAAIAAETAAMIKQLGGEAVSIEGDVTEPNDIERMVQQVKQEYGAIDILVNNAGIAGERLPAVDASVEVWDQVINVNLKSVFLMSRRVIREMLEQGEGVIINIASMAGLIACPAGCDYVAAKHGVIGLTKQLAYEYGRHGIRVNAICPGVIETSLTQHMLREGGLYHDLIKNSPLGRYGRPEEIAGAALFLASDLSRYMQGNLLVVDGGASIY